MQNSLRVNANGDSSADGCGGGKRLAGKLHASKITCHLLLYSLSEVSNKETIEESFHF